MKPWILGLLGLLLLGPVAQAREWSDSTGTHKTEATLVAVRQGKAYLEQPNGKVIQVPFDKLHISDLRYILSLDEHREYFKANPIPSYLLVSSESDAGPVSEPEGATYQVDDPNAVGAIRTFDQIKGVPSQAAFSRDDRFLAISNHIFGLLTLDVDTGRGFGLKLDNTVKHVAWSRDGKTLVAGTQKGGLHVLDVQEDGGLVLKGSYDSLHDKYRSISAIGVSPSGQQVLSGDQSGGLRYWDAASGHIIHTFNKFDREIREIHITTRGKQALVVQSNEVAVLDLENGTILQSTKVDQAAYSGSVAVSRDLSKVAFSKQTWIHVYDIATGRQVAGFDLQPRVTNSEIALSPDGSYLAVCREYGVDLVDVGSSRIVYEFNTDHQLRPQWLTFTSDGRHLAVVQAPGNPKKVEIIRLPEEFAVP